MTSSSAWFSMQLRLFLLLLFAGHGHASEELMQTSPCPGLVSSHDAEQFEQVLVVTDTDFASVEDCAQLGAFYFSPLRSMRYSLDHSRLDSIVDDIWQPVDEETPYLLLDAVLSWLKGLGLDEHADALRELIDRYRPADDSVQLFFTMIIWLIVIAVLLLVLHEFYRAGLLGLPRRRRKAQAQLKPALRPGLSWDSIQTLSLRAQIGALLQYSIEQLAANKLIPSASSYTNHELLACLAKTDAAKAALLHQQIELTEPVLYGDEPATETVVSACRAQSRDLSDA